jgi:hypothetical protein
MNVWLGRIVTLKSDTQVRVGNDVLIADERFQPRLKVVAAIANPTMYGGGSHLELKELGWEDAADDTIYAHSSQVVEVSA